MLSYIKNVLNNMPADWLKLTTHRLDIYDESQAKTQFLEQFENLYSSNNTDATALSELPTAYDYIRLGHPLSSILEWVIAKQNGLDPTAVITFDSKTIPVLAILRKNALDNKKTQICYSGELATIFNGDILKEIYDYDFTLYKIENTTAIPAFEGSTILISSEGNIYDFELTDRVDFFVNTHSDLGSILAVNGDHNVPYIWEIQHVRRRETIAMTPVNALAVLRSLINNTPVQVESSDDTTKTTVANTIQNITNTTTKALTASSGLSMQYAIMMGLIHEARVNHKGKAIKFIVPTNCYGGTNDQARRVAAVTADVDVVDLQVDGDNDMVQSIDSVLSQIAKEDAIPYIIAEIPTNPRVEVPDLEELKAVLSQPRKTANGETAIDPVFILDQTFCPNLHFLGQDNILSSVRAIAYASGSKFPSGGKCTAGYCVSNNKAASLMDKIALHLHLCDNEATALQYEILAEQLPSMLQRIEDAYVNTRAFVSFIEEQLPEAKINFVSEELAAQGFTPSVFSLDLPTKGNTDEERETYRRALNHKLIKAMITEIPSESKYCVSYGQLKGCYWTIPATSTQGTTKEGDKDYIIRAALSGNMDLEHHKKVFADFVEAL